MNMQGKVIKVLGTEVIVLNEIVGFDQYVCAYKDNNGVFHNIHLPKAIVETAHGRN